MRRLALEWSPLAIAVGAPIAFFYVASHQGALSNQDSERSELFSRQWWAACIAAEVAAVVLSAVACSRRRDAPDEPTSQVAILGAVVALLGGLLIGLIYRPGA